MKEERDINLRLVVWALAGLVVLGAAVALGVWWLFDYYRAENERRNVRRTLVEEAPQVPPEPRLQVNPQMDFKAYLEEQQHTLNSYGWVSREQGRVHIPIRRAMELLVERGTE